MYNRLIDGFLSNDFLQGVEDFVTYACNQPGVFYGTQNRQNKQRTITSFAIQLLYYFFGIYMHCTIFFSLWYFFFKIRQKKC